MRKLFLLLLMLCVLAVNAVAGAAQVTDVKWGVDKDNVLRFVIDMTEQAGYRVNVEGKQLTLTVDAQLQNKTARTSRLRSSIAPVMHVVPSGSQTLLKVPLTRELKAGEYKSFTLRKDPQTNRPPRIVLDITADKKLNSVQPAVSNKPTAAAGSGVVVGNKPTGTRKLPPIVTDGASRSGTAKTRDAAQVNKAEGKTEAKQDASKSKDEKKKDKKKDKDKKDSKAKEAADTKIIKGDGSFATSGGLKGKVITLDPGHGGSDPGAIGPNGTYEKNVTLAIGKKIAELLEKKGAKVYLTRTTDVDVYGAGASDVDELQARVNVAEKRNSDLFISLHTNSSVNKKIGGFSSYYYPKTKHDLRIAKAIQKQLTENFGVDDMGVREANFYVIKRCTMPATLLELCFISNKKEEKLMKGNWFQNKTAKLIVEGIEDYFG